LREIKGGCGGWDWNGEVLFGVYGWVRGVCWMNFGEKKEKIPQKKNKNKNKLFSFCQSV